MLHVARVVARQGISSGDCWRCDIEPFLNFKFAVHAVPSQR